MTSMVFWKIFLWVLPLSVIATTDGYTFKSSLMRTINHRPCFETCVCKLWVSNPCTICKERWTELWSCGSVFVKGTLSIFKLCSVVWLPPLVFKLLLQPFRNHWWSLQSDWLSAVQFIPGVALFSSKSHHFQGTLKQNNQSNFKACLR